MPEKNIEISHNYTLKNVESAEADRSYVAVLFICLANVCEFLIALDFDFFLLGKQTCVETTKSVQNKREIIVLVRVKRKQRLNVRNAKPLLLLFGLVSSFFGFVQE